MFTELGIFKLIKRRHDMPFDPVVAILGIRGGDRVLFCGSSRPDIAGSVGAVTGLNGQTTVVDRQEGAAKRVAAGAKAAGALVDFEDAPLTLLPFDAGQWDAVVLPQGLSALGDKTTTILSEAVRVVRPGGRVVILDRVSRPGLFGLFRTADPSATPAETTTTALSGAGLRGVRVLAEVEGFRYIEGTRPYAR